MIAHILKLADYFDQVGLHKKADQLDSLIVKISEDLKTHVVQKGDTLSEIAEKYNVSISDIQEENGMGGSTIINVGKPLKIPSKKKEEQKEVVAEEPTAVTNKFVHKVVSNDTLSQIAEKYGTTTKEIQEANNLKGTMINIGQKLIIPGDYPTEVVAATLLGEVGTTRVESMPSIMKVIKNRAIAKNVSDLDIVMEKDQFEYWTRNSDVSKVLSGNMGRKHKLWSKAFDIASGKTELPDIGGATHYYTGDVPDWANSSKNKCWEPIENKNDPLHTYGIDKSVRAYSKDGYCNPKKG